MKTKILIVSLLTVVLLELWGGSVHAFSIHIEKDDIATGWETLKESKITKKTNTIIAEIWEELHSFITNGLDDIAHHQIQQPTTEYVATIQEKPLNPHYSAPKEQEYFSDILSDKYYKEIVILAKNNIITTSVKKYYPHNHVRLHEVVKMLLKSIEKKTGEEFVQKQKISVKNAPEYYQIAESIGMLQGIDNREQFENILTSKEYSILVENVKKYYPEVTLTNTGEWETITRSQMANLIVKGFNLTEKDISHTNDDVEILISHAMYPFSEHKEGTVTRAGFAQFLAQVHANKYGNNLAKTLGKQRYTDVNYDQNPYMYYLQNQKLLGYLSEVKREKEYFLPEKAVTKHEVYYIVGKAFNKDFNYIIADADKESIQYDELSAIFVQVIASTAKKHTENQKGEVDFFDELSKVFH